MNGKVVVCFTAGLWLVLSAGYWVEGGPMLSRDHAVAGDNSPKSRVRRASPSVTDREKCKPPRAPPSSLEVDTTARLEKLRTLMQMQTSHRQLAAYIIPMSDTHQSEYVSEYDKRVLFISGFSGSAGTAVVLSGGGDQNKAALWTDGRYFLQAENQLDCNWILMKSGVSGTPSISDWLTEKLAAGSKVGADPRMLRYDNWINYKKDLAEGSIDLVPIRGLVDDAWSDPGMPTRPPMPNNDAFIHELQFAGKTWLEKVQQVRRRMENKTNVAVFNYLDENAWLFNLRGTDVPYNPVFFSYSIVEQNKITLYLTNYQEKLGAVALQQHLGLPNGDGVCSDDSNCVNVKDYEDFYADLREVAGRVNKVWVSPMSSYSIYDSLGDSEEVVKSKAYLKPSIVRELKGQKNPVEVEGLRRCHIRDAAALIEFLAMLEKEVKEGKEWTEISAADKLQEIRSKQEHNRGLSFGTISSFGSNGAVIHYTPSVETNKHITTNGVYLLDSGGQYLDGTTDVTRTFHFGQPTDFQKEAYTRVLMGHINLAMAVWTRGTYGRDIDILARDPLWSVGLQYLHGTGHGIGAFLNVHEGPGRIAMGYRSRAYESPLNENMFFSDEPGYYEDGSFGARLETIVMTKKLETKHKFNNMDFLGFEAFTFVPFEPNLIDYDLLNSNQRKWLNAYNKLCLEKIGEEVLRRNGKMEAYKWVVARTKPIPDTAQFVPSSASKQALSAVISVMLLLTAVMTL